MYRFLITYQEIATGRFYGFTQKALDITEALEKATPKILNIYPNGMFVYSCQLIGE